jgi:hypothetical protein
MIKTPALPSAALQYPGEQRSAADITILHDEHPKSQLCYFSLPGSLDHLIWFRAYQLGRGALDRLRPISAVSRAAMVAASECHNFSHIRNR